MNWLEARRAKRRLTAINNRRTESAAMRAEAVVLEDRAVILRMEAQAHDEGTVTRLRDETEGTDP